jgi:FHA domain.
MSTTIGFFKTLRTDGSATSSKKLWLDNQKKMILGSHSSCDIRLRIHGASDNQASFELDMTSGNIYVIHNGKPNTTFLGNRVLQAGERTLVKDGDVISYKDGITCRSFRFEYNPQKRKNKMNRHENSENENPNSLKLRRRSMPTALGTSSTKVPQRMPLMARDCKTVQRPNTSKAIHGLQEAKRVVFDSRHSSKSNSNGSSNHVEKEDCKQKTISNESSCVPSSPLAEETTIKEVVEILHDTVDADDAVLDKILSEDSSDLDISVSSATSKDAQLDTLINEMMLMRI